MTKSLISCTIFLDHLPRHCFVKSPNLLPSGNDLLRWKQEAMLPCVTKLHSITVRDTQLSQSPVCRHTTGLTQETGDASSL